MMDPRKIDLHIHTVISDGTDTPEALLRKVKAAGLELFAVTDHDAVKGGAAVRARLAPGDPAFLTGAEFSCRDEDGKYHILGYGFDPESEPVRDLVALGHGYRMQKVRARLEFLETTYGFAFPEEELRALLSLDNPGKPHIGNLMVKCGYAKTKEEAIKNYVNKLRIRSRYVRPEEAIAGILGGGGIPVLAHPAYGSGDELILGEDMDRRLQKLTGFGLQGMEAFYSGFPARLRGQMIAFAQRYGLYITAGSDYHGTNKMLSLGDTGLAETEKLPEGLFLFLEDVKTRAGALFPAGGAEGPEKSKESP